MLSLYIHKLSSSSCRPSLDLTISTSSDVKVEKVRNELHEKQADESEEAFKQSLDAFKEQASRMHSISKEEYVFYVEKEKIVLKDMIEQLKLQ